jgi:hypothetical protein
MGFGSHGTPVTDRRAIGARIFDEDLVNQMDLVVFELNREADLVGVTRQQSLIADLTKRYRNRGLDITWDESIVQWFRAEKQRNRSQKEWEQWADRKLAAALIPHLPQRLPAHLKKVVVKHHADRIVVGDTRASKAQGPQGPAF